VRRTKEVSLLLVVMIYVRLIYEEVDSSKKLTVNLDERIQVLY
jgi:hypothetical protein